MNTEKANINRFLQHHHVTKIQFNLFKNWHRINSVEVDMTAYNSKRRIVDSKPSWQRDKDIIAYALKDKIQNDELYGGDVAAIIPTEIKITNMYGLDLRSKSGLTWQFEIEQNSGS